MRRFVDLHAHSTASDGDASPSELVALAERSALAAVALTDHDTVAGVPEAARAAEGLAVRLVPGLEISAEFRHGTLHVLGLGVDVNERRLRRTLGELLRARDERNPRMVARLRGMGVDADMDALREIAGGRVVSRLHMAELLVRKGHARDIHDAFDRFVGRGAPAYEHKRRLAPAEAAEVIHGAGGVAAVAHPVQLGCANRAQLERVVVDLAADGIDAIEVYHSDHTPEQTRHFLDLARGRGLLVCGGSDFHGSAKPGVRLGRPRVPRAAVEDLLARIGL